MDDPGVISYRFGTFELDLRAAELRRAGVPVRLQQQPFRVLLRLLSSADGVVTREELRQELWPDGTVVDYDHCLNNAVNRLREALRDDSDRPRFVERLARRGYRFVAPVEVVTAAPPAAVAPAPAPQPPAAPRRRAWGAAVLTAAALALTGAGLLLAGARWQEHGSRRMLAVLPFQDLSAVPGQEYLADGMTEELITLLGRVEPARLGVIAPASALAYKGTSKRADQIGRELGVDYLLEGSLRLSGPRARLTARLSRVSDQTLVWSRDYDVAAREVAGVERQLAAAVAGQMGLQDPGGAPASPGPAAAESYELVLKGRYEVNRRSEESLKRALDHFRHALELRPDDARALAGLADTYLLLGAGDYGVLPAREAMPQAKAAALRALDIDPGLAEARAALAFVAYVYEWDWAAADREFRAAVSADPNYATAHHWYALFLKAVGRRQEARVEFERALQLDPFSLIIATDRAWSLYQLRENDAAIAESAKVLARAPEFTPARWSLGLAELRKERVDDALDHLRQAVSQTGESPARLAELGYAYAAAGRRRDAARILDQLQALSRRRRVSPADLAWIRIGLGESDQAFALLEQAYTERSCLFLNLQLDPRLDPLRGDPRFGALLSRLAFPS
jgi:TolB-like protein/DNA-binding winged helix-turn-helix (wHTH) protein/Flp pilus assembly protein TadD